MPKSHKTNIKYNKQKHEVRDKNFKTCLKGETYKFLFINHDHFKLQRIKYNDN